MNYAVQFTNISFGYNDNITILDNVNFELEFGKVNLLAGLSGEGKSTLASLINGIIPNHTSGILSGEIFVAGRSVKDKSIAYISRYVGSVLQNPEMQIVQPIVKDEIAFGCENFAIDSEVIEKRIDIACNKLGLDKNAETRKLSGGQKQKLITATTLAMGQKILLFDEPLANLDIKSSLELLAILKNLAHNENYCILIIEHRLDYLQEFIDNAFVIRDKKIIRMTDHTSFINNFSRKITTNNIPNECRDILFDVKDIRHKFKNTSVLDGVNFKINKGERVLILGDNGCGKTTLTKIIARLIKQSKGDVDHYLCDKKNKRLSSTKWFNKVGYVYQNPNYQLFMQTVSQEILYNGHSLEYCQQIVDLFGLGNLLDRHPLSLSEGQKRKVTIASVLASKPDVLILDEPTVGQDYENLQKLVQILCDINMVHKTTIITITHDVRCAEALCDKAIVIRNGIADQAGDKNIVSTYFKN